MHGPEKRQLTPPLGDGDHIRGGGTASVTLVEYGDFECSDTHAAYPVIRALRAELGDRLRFAYRHYPLTHSHQHAETLAEAVEAAGAQGKFWEMHDDIFERWSNPAVKRSEERRVGKE